MNVQELIAELRHADPEAEVLFIDHYADADADADAADEVRLVDIRQETWTH
jgi:hypothetical protein